MYKANRGIFLRAIGEKKAFALAILSISIVVIALSGCIESGGKSNLGISEMDIEVKSVKSAFVDLNVTTYVENSGGHPKENASILLKATNKETGLLETQSKADIGKVQTSKTAAFTQTIRLPRSGGYNLRAIIFDGDERVGSLYEEVNNLENLPADVENSGIKIGEMDFIVRKVGSGNVVIQNDIYITNVGMNLSNTSQIIIKAKEKDANLIADKQEATLGRIDPERTVVKSINLTVPDQYNYIIQAQIWNNGILISRGEDKVILSPEGEKVKEGEHIEPGTTIETSRFVAEDMTSSAPSEREVGMPGFSLFLAFASIALAFVAGKKKRS